MADYQYTVYFEPLPDGAYNVVVPAMPDICTFGRSLNEARHMAKDAILCVIEAAQKSGEQIPTDPVSGPEPVLQERLSVSA